MTENRGRLQRTGTGHWHSTCVPEKLGGRAKTTDCDRLTEGAYVSTKTRLLIHDTDTHEYPCVGDYRRIKAFGQL